MFRQQFAEKSFDRRFHFSETGLIGMQSSAERIRDVAMSVSGAACQSCNFSSGFREKSCGICPVRSGHGDDPVRITEECSVQGDAPVRRDINSDLSHCFDCLRRGKASFLSKNARGLRGKPVGIRLTAEVIEIPLRHRAPACIACAYEQHFHLRRVSLGVERNNILHFRKKSRVERKKRQKDFFRRKGTSSFPEIRKARCRQEDVPGRRFFRIFCEECCEFMLK